MNIITGYKAEPHITAQQDRNVNMGIFGTGTYIVNIGSKMAATVVSANEITIADGLLVAEGCTAEIERGTSESLEIANGSQSMLRKDLIVARYTKASGTGVEDMQLAVITGTPAASNPALPSYNTGSIVQGDTLVDFPLYTVNLDGISIESVDRMVEYAELASKAAVDGLVTQMGTAALNTTANKVTNAINELLSSITGAISRIGALETKTAGIVRTSAFSIAGSGTDYKQLAAVATYILIVDSAYPSATMKGMYLIGVAGTNEISVKAVSAASDVAITDAGNRLLRIINNGNAYIRCTLITTYTG
jgi:hypothetical protein